MFETSQILLLVLAIALYSFTTTRIGFGFPAGGIVIQGLITGAVMGDLSLGFYMGGTYELMNIGLNPLGGSVVPNYQLGVICGAAFGAATGNEALGLAAGTVIATLSTTLTLLGRMINTAIFHKIQACIRAKDFDGMNRWMEVGWWPSVLVTPVCLFILLFLGQPVVETINSIIPDWILNGFSVAGSVLPCVGFAILLRSMNMKGNLQYLILGFAIYAYFGVGALGAALIGIVCAMNAYNTNSKIAAVENIGGVGDE